MKGYLPHRVVKAVVFWVLTSCIVSATIAGILSAWDEIYPEVATRWVWTALILSAGSLLFLFVNLLFGGMAAEWFSSRPAAPPIDPAFAERLHRAKEMGTSETQRKAE